MDMRLQFELIRFSFVLLLFVLLCQLLLKMTIQCVSLLREEMITNSDVLT
jgi:hypothetical protein